MYFLADHAGRYFTGRHETNNHVMTSYYVHQAQAMTLDEAKQLRLSLGDNAWVIHSKSDLQPITE